MIFDKMVLDKHGRVRFGRFLTLILTLAVAAAAVMELAEGLFSNSDLRISTDVKTGVQYVSDRNGGITPRLDAYGNVMVKTGYED